MRVNVDEKAYNDPRFRRLAALMGWHVDQAVGSAVRLWMAALNRISEENSQGLLAREEADFCTDHGAQLVDAMVTVALAKSVDNSYVYFAGIEERGDFLLKQRLKGAKGGRNRARSQRLANAQAGAKPEPSRSSSKGSSLISGSGSGSGSGYENTSGSSEPLKLVTPEPSKTSEVTQLKAAFEPWFQETYGSAYTWSAREGKHAKALIQKAGGAVDEVMRRARVAAGENWRTSPVTLGALESAWNSLGGRAQNANQNQSGIPLPAKGFTPHGNW